MKQLFIGLDVHKKTWAVTIQEDQLILKRFTIDADADLLIGYVAKHFPHHQVQCCYECCCCGYHIYHSLTAAGWQVMVVNPGDIARGNKQVAIKTDKVDSAHLARELEAGRLLPETYDNINWSKDMIQWVYKQRWSYAPATEAMKSRLEEYLFLRKQYLHVGNELRSYARKNFKKDYYLLRTVPGIGPLTAIGMLAEVGDIRRFKSIDHLSSYIGLVPSVYSSGEKSYSRGITYRSKRLLRSYLVEGAWVAAKQDPSLMVYYEERKGCDHKKLIIKLAAKTLSRIYHVIKTGEPYELLKP